MLLVSGLSNKSIKIDVEHIAEHDVDVLVFSLDWILLNSSCDVRVLLRFFCHQSSSYWPVEVSQCWLQRLAYGKPQDGPRMNTWQVLIQKSPSAGAGRVHKHSEVLSEEETPLQTVRKFLCDVLDSQYTIGIRND